jgi:hypothetical protein
LFVVVESLDIYVIHLALILDTTVQMLPTGPNRNSFQKRGA